MRFCKEERDENSESARIISLAQWQLEECAGTNVRSVRPCEDVVEAPGLDFGFGGRFAHALLEWICRIVGGKVFSGCTVGT